jgi:ornithine cyclodeaminase
MLALNADILLPQLGFARLVEALRQGHRDGVDAFERSLLTEQRPDGTVNHFLVWPAWRFQAYCGVKVVTVFPSQDPAKPSNSTIYLLFDGVHGAPRACFTGDAFTTWKTAADSALGSTFLSRPDARTLLMVGAGAQALPQIAAHRSVRPSLARFLVWNRSAGKAAGLARVLTAEGCDADAVDDLSGAVAEADIITCATAATTPLLHGLWLRPGTHLDLVGGFTNAMREADDEAARRARIFVDSRRFVLGQCGDVTGPIEAGVISEADIRGDLFDLCAGRVAGRETPDEITLFKNGGGGHLDLMTAIALYEHARAAPHRDGSAQG